MTKNQQICKTTFRYERTHSASVKNTAPPPYPPLKNSTPFRLINGCPENLSKTTVVLYGAFGSTSAWSEVCSGEDAVLPRPELASKGWWQDSVPWCITVGRLIKSGRGTCRVWNPAMSEHGNFERRRKQIVLRYLA